MWVTKKSRIAVDALVDLASHHQNGPVVLVEISRRLKHSVSHLENIFRLLRNGGIVEGMRGRHGGYSLARPAEEVTVADIILAIDGPFIATTCDGAVCVTHDLWAASNNKEKEFFASVSLKDLVDTTREKPANASNAQPGAVASSFEKNLCDMAHALILSRQNVSAKRLIEPGPSAIQIEQLLSAAAAAPDHGLLIPWRFVIVPQHKRALLGEGFALALIDRDCGATAEQIASAREKAQRAPFLMLAIARLGPNDSGIPEVERIVSLGCALQNILLMAHAMGFGAGLTSGQAMRSPRMRDLFKLADGEQPVCCVNVGTVEERKRQRSHPAPAEFSLTL